MPEFKLVVSDPRIKQQNVIPIKVIGLEDLEYSDKHKEQRELPKVKVHSGLLKLLDPGFGVVVIRIWKNRANREKVNLVAIAEEGNVPDIQTVGVPIGFMREKLGATEALGEIFAASSFQIVVGGDIATRLIGLKIGDRIDGRIIGLKGVMLEIRGGSDLAGFPMRVDISGSVKKYILLSKGPGFRPKEEGERRRKLVRGNTISDDIVQINAVVIPT